MISGLSVAVVCGGRSRRFGSNKSLALFRGKPLVEHISLELKPLTDDLFLVTKEHLRPSFDFLGVRIVVEPQAEFASILGIRQALEAAHHDWVMVVAVDMPCLSSEFIYELWDQRSPSIRAIFPKTNRIQPLCALYQKSFLPEIQNRCQKQQFRLQELADYNDVISYPCPAEFEDCLQNINRPEDLLEVKGP